VILEFVWGVLGAVFGAGVAYATVRADISKGREAQERENALFRKDLNGLGSKIRQDEGRAERRWKHMIATQIETSANLAEAKKHATLLREDAWRD
jgi:hypothetical protein